MGYESRIYVVDKHKTIIRQEINGKQYTWGEVIAIFDLCKAYDVSDRMRQYPATDAYIYADDGNTEIVADCYGSPLREIPLKDAIQIIEDAAASEPNCRRYTPCLRLLQGFDESEWDNLVVLHFGY